MASMYYKEMFLENKLAKHSVWPEAKLGGSPVAEIYQVQGWFLRKENKTKCLSDAVGWLKPAVMSFICLKQGQTYEPYLLVATVRYKITKANILNLLLQSILEWTTYISLLNADEIVSTAL